MTQYDIVIIGGGASGLMATAIIKDVHPDASVLLIEKNKKLGEKLSITGGGRCNITNAIFDNKELLKKYGSSEKFLYSPFSQFSVQDTFNFFEKRGLPLVTQEHRRVFPLSEKATDVTKLLVEHCKNPNITIKTNTTIKQIHIDSETKKIDFIETAKGEKNQATSYILATGGLSHPETGSTGDGFAWLKNSGHIIKNPTPTLVPWKISDKWIHTNSGNTIEHCKLTILVDNKKYFSCTGKILCTHTGLSGPLILNNSNKLQDALYSGKITCYIDMYPDKNHKELDEYVLDIFEKNKNKKIKNVLTEITRLKKFDLFIEQYIPFDVDTPIHSLSKESRKSLIHLLKQIPINVTGLEGYNKSIVADGGVPLKEIDMKTMQSIYVSNLYITGDLLDIRRPSGGFSLQLCWTTGYVAGVHCLKK